MKTLSFDVVIIGSGIVGSAIAYELSKYKIKLAVLEKILHLQMKLQQLIQELSIVVLMQNLTL